MPLCQPKRWRADVSCWQVDQDGLSTTQICWRLPAATWTAPPATCSPGVHQPGLLRWPTLGRSDRWCAPRGRPLELADDAAQKGWREECGDSLTDDYQQFIGLEHEVTSIAIWHIDVVPGMLQTEALLGADDESRF